MFLVASGAFDGFVVTVMRIRLELGRFSLHGLTTLVTRHAGALFGNFTRLDIAVAGFARQIHGFVRAFESHCLGCRCIACGQKSNAQRSSTGCQ